MPRDWNKCVETKAGTIVTPRARMMYPSIFEKSAVRGDTSNKLKYRISLLIPAKADLSLLKNAAQKVLDDNMTAAKQKQHKIKTPFLKTEDMPRLASLAEEFPVLLRAAADFKPTVVNANMSDCNDEEQAYSGRWCVASLNAYFWEHATGGVGISLGLNNVMLLENDDVLAGGKVKAEDEFEAADTTEGASASSVFA
jgi:hypothetical protein